MDTPRTERGLKRRQALLDAATDIFSTEGYTGTTLDMIIARAGGSRRSLYQYFGDKDGLFSAVMQHHVGTMMAELEATGVEHLPASEGLHRLSSTFVKLMLSPLYLELIFFRKSLHPRSYIPQGSLQTFRKTCTFDAKTHVFF